MVNLHYLQVQDLATAQKISRALYLLKAPNGFNHNDLAITLEVPIKEHPINPTAYGAVLMMPDAHTIPIHFTNVVAFLIKGNTNLTTEQEKQVADIYEHNKVRINNWLKEDGTYPIQDLDSFKQTIIDHYNFFTTMFPDESERDAVEAKMLEGNSVLWSDLLPSWINVLTSLERFEQKWDSVSFNRVCAFGADGLSPSECLESARFPGIGSATAQDIIEEFNTNGAFVDSQDVANRVSGVGDSFVAELENQLDEKSLTFNEN